MPEFDPAYEADRSLRRIRPKINDRIREHTAEAEEHESLVEVIEGRLSDNWLRFFRLLHRLYGSHYDFFFYLESIVLTAVEAWLKRPEELRQLDLRRENDPEWYLSERMMGESLYVDLFAGDLTRLRRKIPYLKDLGLTYLHLMPLFSSRPGNSDGGYAINDFRSVESRLGTMEELQTLATELREAGISLVLDFVFNHTSDDHEWALRAQEGEREFMDYYHIYPDRTIPDQYEANLREIFPTVRRGNFTWHDGLRRWVWTTFNSFQWDLKYANPEVFRAMAGEMLFLANVGIEILRLDAVAFIWKKLGTNCENLPEAHLLIQAFNSLCRIAAPSLVFKSEAIVHPDEVVRYVSPEECQLSYNPTTMALLWESLATRNTDLLEQSLSHRHTLPRGTVWINYLRGHDDIGWSFDNMDAWKVGINPSDHRDFLNRFYTGRFPGSFAAGVPFQHNEDTGDMRVSGTMASLAGLEQAMEMEHPLLIQMALRRIHMVHGVLASIGGVPLLFMGDEWGMLNDYSYMDDPDKQDDSRWVHRNTMDWKAIRKLKKDKSPHFMVYQGIMELFKMRKALPALRGSQMRIIPCASSSVLCYLRWNDNNLLAVVANFSEKEIAIDLSRIGSAVMSRFVRDTFTDRAYSVRDTIELDPYELLWLRPD